MLKRLIVLGVLMAALAACRTPARDTIVSTPSYRVTTSPLGSPVEPVAEPTPVPQPTAPMELQTGMAGVEGRILTPSVWRNRVVTIYAAPFVAIEDDNTGFFVLEPSIHAQAELSEGGYFQLADLEPGPYVLVVGPHPDEAVALQDMGTIQVFRVAADESLDIGEHDIR